jgi:hypothetical protein
LSLSLGWLFVDPPPVHGRSGKDQSGSGEQLALVSTCNGLLFSSHGDYQTDGEEGPSRCSGGHGSSNEYDTRLKPPERLHLFIWPKQRLLANVLPLLLRRTHSNTHLQVSFDGFTALW